MHKVIGLFRTTAPITVIDEHRYGSGTTIAMYSNGVFRIGDRLLPPHSKKMNSFLSSRPHYIQFVQEPDLDRVEEVFFDQDLGNYEDFNAVKGHLPKGAETVETPKKKLKYVGDLDADQQIADSTVVRKLGDPTKPRNEEKSKPKTEQKFNKGVVKHAEGEQVVMSISQRRTKKQETDPEVKEAAPKKKRGRPRKKKVEETTEA